MGAWPPRFLFISGWLCVDFAQTGGEGPRAKWERLNKPGDLSDWLMSCTLGVEVREIDEDDLRVARRLREAIWQGAQAVLHDRAMPADVVAIINKTAGTPDLTVTLEDGVIAWAPGATVSQAMSSIARDAIELFGGERRHRLRECANPRCPLLFVDESRPGRRSWCAMRRCGNMEKTKRYRRSLKARSEMKEE